MPRIPSLLLTSVVCLALAAGCGGGSVAEFADGPTIASVEPASGGTAGGTPLVIRGANLANPQAGEYQVLIGGQPAVEVTVLSATEVECKTPPGTQGAADVEVVMIDGDAVAPSAFMYYPPPTVTSITPNEGTRDGGTPVTVTGTGFTANDPGETVCLIELKPLDSLVVVDDTTLTGLSPSSWIEVAKDVTVVNRNGSGTLARGFTYFGPIPQIYSITPTEGPRSGGTACTITGDFFTIAGGELSVRFGNAEASIVTRVDDQTLTCISPLAPVPGFTDVSVGNVNGESTLPGAFYYIPAPLLSGISPATGTTSGGDPVTITGLGFTAPGAGLTIVTIGDNPVSNLVVVNDTTITCDTPSSAVTGLVDVRIVNGNGAATLSNAFDYTFALAWDSDYGSTIGTSDDTSTLVNFGGGFTFDYFGSTYTSVYFGSNGHLGFGAADSWYSSAPSYPHINFMARDMNPGAAGALYVKQEVDRIVFTMVGVPMYYNTGSNTVQIVLHSSGMWGMMYDNIEATGFYVTVGPGSGQSSLGVDWTNEPSSTSSQMMTEYQPTDLEGYGLLFMPNSAGGFDTTLFPL